MKKSITLTIGVLVMAGIFAAGCSSSPSEEEMKQLEELRAEVASLEKQVPTLESEKAKLQAAIAEKDAKLKKCEEDKKVAQDRLKGM